MNSRVLRAAAAVLALVALTAACGGAPAQPAATSAPAASGGSATDTFPVTVTHKMGTTVIPAAPQRVVTVGLRDQDFVLALGVRPVGVAEWYPEVAGGIGPWAKETMGASEPAVVASIDSVNIEAVAALQPDLILSIYAASDPAVYGKLSKIAPTVTAPVDTEDYALSWQQQLTQTGAALGQSARAAALGAELEGRIAAAKAAHPEFSGQSVIYGAAASRAGTPPPTSAAGS